MLNSKAFKSIKVLRVLVVDDDYETADLIAVHLRRAGATVSIASNGAEALRQIGDDPPDIVITDWEMPQMDGKQLCRKIREGVYEHYIYLLLMTAHECEVDLVDALDSGADAYAPKPIEPREIVARVHAAARFLEVEKQLRAQAVHDSLTGVHNRLSLLGQIEKEFARHARFDTIFSIVMVDIDDFKTVNAKISHTVGDEVLRRVAKIMSQPLRQCDAIGRLGGDEFCFILSNTDETQAITCADRIRQGLADTRIVASDKSIRITASFGVATCTNTTADTAELIHQADCALAMAQEAGRNRVCSFNGLSPETACGNDSRETAFLEYGLAEYESEEFRGNEIGK